MTMRRLSKILMVISLAGVFQINALCQVEKKPQLDEELVAELKEIMKEDQDYRIKAIAMNDSLGHKSPEAKALWKKVRESDSLNLIKVEAILEERGWLSSNVVGKEGNLTLFLVIQHSNLKTQEKWLPVIREAVKLGNASGSHLALLEDRVAVGLGKEQVYGSQLGMDNETGKFFLHPIVDPENVDERRKTVGLGTLQEYVSYWGMTWDLEKHLKRIKEIEKTKKN